MLNCARRGVQQQYIVAEVASNEQLLLAANRQHRNRGGKRHSLVAVLVADEPRSVARRQLL